MGRVWRSAGGEFWMTGSQPTVKHTGFSLMVWGTIWHNGKCEPVLCEGGINSAKCIEILKEALLPNFASAHVDKNQHLSWKMVPPVIQQNDTSLA